MPPRNVLAHIVITIAVLACVSLIVALRASTQSINVPGYPPIGDNDWFWNGSNLYVNPNAGAVGIGTTNPNYKLDVAGNVRVQDIYLGYSAGEGSIFNVDIIKGYNDIRFRLGDNNYRFEFQNSTGYVKAFITSLGYIYTPRLYITEEGDETSPKWHLDYVPDNGRLALVYDASGTSTELAAITSSGNVGIGTSNPQARLEVIGDLKLTNPSDSNRYIHFFFGSLNDMEYNGTALIIHPAWANGYDPSSLVYLSGNVQDFKVGIGTDNPEYKLDVAGDIRARGESVFADYFKLTEQGVPTGWLLDYFPDNRRIGFIVNGTEVVSLLPNGYVGIGTTNPQYKLHVKGGNIAVNNTGIVGYEIFSETDNKRWFIGYDPSNDYFYIDEYGVARHLVIRNGGNVGIGTTNPSYKLDVNGDIRSISGTVYADYFELTEAGNPTSFKLDYYPSGVQGKNAIGVDTDGDGSPEMLVDSSGYIYAPRLYITEEGSESTPYAYLDYYPSGGYLLIAVNNTIVMKLYDHMVSTNGKDIVTGGGRILTDGGYINTSGGPILTFGGLISTGGGNIYTYGGDIVTGNGSVRTNSLYTDYLYITENGSPRWLIDFFPDNNRTSFIWLGDNSEKIKIYPDGELWVSGNIVANNDLWVYGDLYVIGTKNFDIPDPNPEKAAKGWRLRHASIESNEVLVMYRGKVVINSSGFAVIELPDYFKYLVNTSTVTVHLTKYGRGDVYVYKEDYKNNRVIIEGTPGLEVSWIILGVRKGYENYQAEYLPQQNSK